VNPLVSDDGTLEGTHLLRWNTLLVEATDNLGVSLRSPKDYKQQLTDAGYKNVTQVEFKWPTNPWPKDPKHKELGKQQTATSVLESLLTDNQARGPWRTSCRPSKHSVSCPSRLAWAGLSSRSRPCSPWSGRI